MLACMNIYVNNWKGWKLEAKTKCNPSNWLRSKFHRSPTIMAIKSMPLIIIKFLVIGGVMFYI